MKISLSLFLSLSCFVYAKDNISSQSTPSVNPPKSDKQPPSKPEKLPLAGETTPNVPLENGDEPDTAGGGAGGGARRMPEVGKGIYEHIAEAAQPVALCLVAGALHFSTTTERDAPAYVEAVDRICTLLTFLSGAGLSIYSMNTQPCQDAAFYQKQLVSFGFLSALLPFILRLGFP